MKRTTRMRFGLLSVAAAGMIGGYELAGSAQSSGQTSRMPVFEVDTSWPKLPNNWVFGIVSSVTVDKRDHVWVIHRPRTVPEATKDRAAPAVLEFDAAGKVVNTWGGPAEGYDWPDTEHGIFIDYKNNIWITGSGEAAKPTLRSDDMILKFTNQGKFLMQIGGRTTNKGNADTKNLRRAAGVDVYLKTNELFVADGYGNRRVVVFDADTGAFKRLWGAFANKPEDAPPDPNAEPGPGGQQPKAKRDVEGPGPQQFTNPVHDIKVSNDGIVYVADRGNHRIQVFTPEGKYVTQVFLNRTAPGNGSAAGFAFSPDPQQEFLYVADYPNSHMAVYRRKTLDLLYQFGTRSADPGHFRGPHHIAVDSKGNLYTAEVNPGNRAQRFLFKGMSPTPPPNTLTAAQLAAP